MRTPFRKPGRAGESEPCGSKEFTAVLSGSFRRNPVGLQEQFTALCRAGCRVLSPPSGRVVQEIDGFAFMEGEADGTPVALEQRHLRAIQEAHFVWLYCPDGYIGPSASLEVGYAHANGIPIFTKTAPHDPVIRSFVRPVESPAAAIARVAREPIIIPPALATLQAYYRRIATERGFDKEDITDCMVLLTEEIGELASFVRSVRELPRHHAASPTSGSLELADVLLYIVHMANILQIDLAQALADKEEINLKRFRSSTTLGDGDV